MKTVTFVKILAVGILLSGAAFAAEEGEAKPTAEGGAAKPPLVLETDADKVSYALGIQIAQSFNAQQIAVNREVLFRATEDFLLEVVAPAKGG